MMLRYAMWDNSHIHSKYSMIIGQFRTCFDTAPFLYSSHFYRLNRADELFHHPLNNNIVK